jgi:hypothetical protein
MRGRGFAEVKAKVALEVLAGRKTGNAIVGGLQGTSAFRPGAWSARGLRGACDAARAQRGWATDRGRGGGFGRTGPIKTRRMGRIERLQVPVEWLGADGTEPTVVKGRGWIQRTLWCCRGRRGVSCSGLTAEQGVGWPNRAL